MKSRTRLVGIVSLLTVPLMVLAGCSDSNGTTGGSEPQDTPAQTADEPDDQTDATGGDAGGDFPAGSTMAEIVAAGEVRVGVKTTVPYFGQANPITGNFEGLDIEVAKAIAERLFGEDGHATFSEAPTPSREELLMSNKMDLVIATYTINDERAAKVNFAGPYYEAANGLLVRADNEEFVEDYAGSAALDGHAICAGLNSPAYIELQDRPDVELTGFDTEAKCAAAVQQGRVAGYAADSAILLGFLESDPGTYRLVMDTAGPKQPYGIGIAKERTDLCEWVNEQLTDIVESGEWQEMYAATIGTVVEGTPEPPNPAGFTYCS